VHSGKIFSPSPDTEPF